MLKGKYSQWKSEKQSEKWTVWLIAKPVEIETNKYEYLET